MKINKNFNNNLRAKIVSDFITVYFVSLLTDGDGEIFHEDLF